MKILFAFMPVILAALVVIVTINVIDITWPIAGLIGGVVGGVSGKVLGKISKDTDCTEA